MPYCLYKNREAEEKGYAIFTRSNLVKSTFGFYNKEEFKKRFVKCTPAERNLYAKEMKKHWEEREVEDKILLAKAEGILANKDDLLGNN